MNKLAVLFLSLFFLIVPSISQGVISVFIVIFMYDIELLAWLQLASNFWWLNLIPKAAGFFLLSYVVVRFVTLRFDINAHNIKGKLTKFSVYTLLIALTIGLVVTVDIPLAKAEITVLTEFILGVPISNYDWYIGKYSDGTYYAVNGANWDNMVTGVGSTAWNPYKTNTTKLQELVLSVITSGTVFLKNVPFNYGLTIPQKVTVIEHLNGLEREFINSADSQGSPYTISLDTVHTGYYLTKDNQGRIINSWSSKDTSELMQTIHDNLPTRVETYLQGPTPVKFGKIVFEEGLFVCHSQIIIDPCSRIEWVGQGIGRTILKFNSTEITTTPSGAFSYSNIGNIIGGVGSNSEARQFLEYGASVNIHDMSIDTSEERYLSSITVSGLCIGMFRNLELKGYFMNRTGELQNAETISTYGIRVYNSTINVKMILDNLLAEGYREGFEIAADHVTMSSCQACNCYYGFVWNNGMDMNINNVHGFRIYHQIFLFNHCGLIQSSFNNLFCEGLISNNTSAWQIYIAPEYGLENVYLKGVHFGVDNKYRMAGGRVNLVHWADSIYVEDYGTATFNNNQTMSFPLTLMNVPTVGNISCNNTANTFGWTAIATEGSIWVQPVAIVTITSSNSNCNDTIYYSFQYYP